MVIAFLISNNAFAGKSYQGINGQVYEGMSKQKFCKQEYPAALRGACQRKSEYFRNGIEVHGYKKRYAIFKNVTAPITSGAWTKEFGNGTFYAMAYSWSEVETIINNLQTGTSTYSNNNNTGDNMNIANMIERSKDTCKSLGFNEGTEKFADCSLKLYSQSLDLAAKQNQQVVVQNQGNSSNKMIIYDPVRDSENLQRRALGLINGSCSIANYINC